MKSSGVGVLSAQKLYEDGVPDAEVVELVCLPEDEVKAERDELLGSSKIASRRRFDRWEDNPIPSRTA